MVWTPDVLVFRNENGEDLRRNERWWIDVTSAGMLRFPDVDKPDARHDDAAEDDGATYGAEEEEEWGR